MKITIWKSRKIQVEQFEPIDFGYGLEDEGTEKDPTKLTKIKESMEALVDTWLEVETLKWTKYKNQPKHIQKRKIEAELKDKNGEPIPFKS